MELGHLTGKIAGERQRMLKELELEAAETQAGINSRERAVAEFERLSRPYKLVHKMMAGRGVFATDQPSFHPNGRVKMDANERFRMKPTTITIGESEKTISMDLNVTTELWTEHPIDSERSRQYKLSLITSSPGEPETTHYLTDISKPIVKSNGIPEDYGMRAYRRGERDKYEVNSSVPTREVSEVIISALEEAAELAGVYFNDEERDLI